jgi:hypothetical protein
LVGFVVGDDEVEFDSKKRKRGGGQTKPKVGRKPKGGDDIEVKPRRGKKDVDSVDESPKRGRKPKEADKDDDKPNRGRKPTAEGEEKPKRGKNAKDAVENDEKPKRGKKADVAKEDKPKPGRKSKVAESGTKPVLKRQGLAPERLENSSSEVDGLELEDDEADARPARGSRRKKLPSEDEFEPSD